RVDTLTELFDVAQLLAYQPLPPGSRVATVTNSSALGVLVADACAAAGLDAGGTVDVGPDADVPTFMAGVREAIDRADALVAVFAPALATPGDDYARALAEIAATSRVPVLTTFLGTEGVPAPLRRFSDDRAGGAGTGRRDPVRGVAPAAHRCAAPTGRHRSGSSPRDRRAGAVDRCRRPAAHAGRVTPAAGRIPAAGGRVAGRDRRGPGSGSGRAARLPHRGQGDRAGAAAPAGPRRGQARPCGRDRRAIGGHSAVPANRARCTGRRA